MERTILTTTDFSKVRGDFPILQREVHPGVPLVYLDSTASSQKPNAVIEAMDTYLPHAPTRISTAACIPWQKKRPRCMKARAQRIAAFIGAKAPEEVIYTRNATEVDQPGAVYLGTQVPASRAIVILLTEMEHHSNLVPWQMLAAERGIAPRVYPGHRRLPVRHGGLPRAAQAGAEAGGFYPHVQHAGHDHPGQGDHPPGARRPAR